MRVHLRRTGFVFNVLSFRINTRTLHYFFFVIGIKIFNLRKIKVGHDWFLGLMFQQKPKGLLDQLSWLYPAARKLLPVILKKRYRILYPVRAHAHRGLDYPAIAEVVNFFYKNVIG